MVQAGELQQDGLMATAVLMGTTGVSQRRAEGCHSKAGPLSIA